MKVLKTMHNIFFILNGNNGATYILNAKNWYSITTSFAFYRANSLKSKVLKQGLSIALFVMGKLARFKLKNKAFINNTISQTVNHTLDFELDDNCSVLISPTKDKVIVHHHNQYFQKFGFGKSYNKVKRESDIYKRLPLKPKAFQTSEIQDVKDVKDQFCAFKLSNATIKTSNKQNIDAVLVPVLIEFFKYSSTQQITFTSYIKDVVLKLESAGLSKHTEAWSGTMDKRFGNFLFPLGLVHRDFKPWNVLAYKTPLIYDFEEAVLQGLPLEDLFNYYIDPIIRYQSTALVSAAIFSASKVNSYNAYLKSLGIKADYQPFLISYLLERILFWQNAKEHSTSNAYAALLKDVALKFQNT